MEIIDPRLGHGLIETAGGADFGATALAAGQAVANVDEVYGFRAPPGEAPQGFASSSVIQDAEQRARVYAAHFHRFDPLAYDRLATPVGQGLATVLRSNDIALKEYRALCFDAPALRFKYSFGWHDPMGWFILNFYTRGTNDPRALGRLAALANVGLSAMVRLCAAELTPRARAARLEGRLAALSPGLTARERQVLARTLLGDSSERIAAELGIGATSVLTYRQRAYRRLNVSSAAALLPALGVI